MKPRDTLDNISLLFVSDTDSTFMMQMHLAGIICGSLRCRSMRGEILEIPVGCDNVAITLIRERARIN